MKKILSIIAIASTFVACNTNSSEKTTENKQIDAKKNQEAFVTEGYQLMKQKCFVCHMEKPDLEKRASMIAPPMLRVQEHYKPTYKTKDEFVQAITSYVLNPDEGNSLMPGAVRKFHVMPHLGYSKEDVTLIAETLFDVDFGSMPKMKIESGKLSLNNGEKWKLKAESMEAVDNIIEKINNFQSDDIAAYNQLGKEVFDHAKTILLDTDYKGELLDQIHFFFGNVEENIHALEATSSLDEAKQLVEKMKKQFAEFGKYFEAE